MATTPTVFDFPVRRHEMIISASWGAQQGSAEMPLTILYLDSSGTTRSVAFQAGGDYPSGASRGRDICLPVTMKDPGLIHRDMLVAHVRMAAYLAHAVMGTREFTDAILTTSPDNEVNFQTAAGVDVQVTGIERVDETNYDLTFYCKNGSSHTVRVGHDEIGAYSFDPSTQLQTLPGHLKTNLGFIHDAPGDLLTQGEMDEIIACIMHTGSYAPGGADEDKAWKPFV